MPYHFTHCSIAKYSLRLCFHSKPTEYPHHVTITPNLVSTTDKYLSSASSVASHVFNSFGTINTSSKSTPEDQDHQITGKYPRNHFIPTMAPVNEIITTTSSLIPTTFSHHSTDSYAYQPSSETSTTLKPIPTIARPSTTLHNENIVYQENFEKSTLSPPTELPSTKNQVFESLATLLRREGLFAMAKYLRQSGLDNVLNETGKRHIPKFVFYSKPFHYTVISEKGF